ncbi:hypothetical protein [Actinophytocola sp.]|uniref:hypothetical protein n=1 Tax=Actinophytocola sp. TaxID=1872138 RepID=UPI002D7FD51B|nr:hypothetical protein [Actinophytocola sp.]HET9141806.1 hypothetical protein [Actinophytocola sp.]
MTKLYQPWPTPVRAACFHDAATLPEIERWVGELRDDGRVGPGTHLTVQRRGGALIGVLHDQSGDHELLPGSFLVFGRGGLRVLDERTFFRLYREH